MSAKDFKAKRRARELTTCRHFTGIQHEACAAGIRYADARDESTRPYGFPCLEGPCTKPCPKRETRTAAEVEAEEAEFERLIQGTVPARAAILATKKPHGHINCPLCGKAQALAFTVSSYNGHVHAQCATKGCLSWME